MMRPSGHRAMVSGDNGATPVLEFVDRPTR